MRSFPTISVRLTLLGERGESRLTTSLPSLVKVTTSRYLLTCAKLVSFLDERHLLIKRLRPGYMAGEGKALIAAYYYGT